MSFVHYVGSHGFHSPTQRVSRVGDDVVTRKAHIRAMKLKLQELAMSLLLH